MGSMLGSFLKNALCGRSLAGTKKTANHQGQISIFGLSAQVRFKSRPQKHKNTWEISILACTGHQKPKMARWEPKTDPGETQERPRRAQKDPKRDQDQHTSKMCTALRRDANFSQKVRRAAAGTQVLHFLKKCTGLEPQHIFRANCAQGLSHTHIFIQKGKMGTYRKERSLSCASAIQNALAFKNEHGTLTRAPKKIPNSIPHTTEA